MAIVTLILLKLTGLYLTIAIGFFAVRKLHLPPQPVSKLLFYVIVPLVFLHGISKMRMEGEILLLPPVIALTSCLLCLATYRLARLRYHDKAANILAFTAGNGNIGYFGIPVAVLLFSEGGLVGLNAAEGAQTLAVYMVMILGIMIYEATLGYYVTTLGDFSPRQALKKILALPMLHGSLLGILLSLLQWPLPDFLEDFFLSLRGAYTILGMMLVGMGLAGMQKWELDGVFLAIAFAVKFVAWPLAIGGWIWLDETYFHLFGPAIHQAARLLSLVPLAVNSVIFAQLLDAHPGKMATAVFLSTLFALIYLPLMAQWLIL